MAYYTQYEKLQKYYKDGIAVSPAEYKKGELIKTAQFNSLEDCETLSVPVIPDIPDDNFPIMDYATFKTEYENAGLIVPKFKYEVYMVAQPGTTTSGNEIYETPFLMGWVIGFTDTNEFIIKFKNKINVGEQVLDFDKCELGFSGTGITLKVILVQKTEDYTYYKIHIDINTISFSTKNPDFGIRFYPVHNDNIFKTEGSVSYTFFLTLYEYFCVHEVNNKLYINQGYQYVDEMNSPYKNSTLKDLNNFGYLLE